MLKKILETSRFMIVLAIIGALLAAMIVLLFGIVDIYVVIVEIFHTGIFTIGAEKYLAASTTSLIDLFLLGTTLYLIALGLYQLFFQAEIQRPQWYVVHSIDDLKDKLIGVVAVILLVFFLGQVVDWDKGSSIVALGAGIGAVLVGMGLLQAIYKYGLKAHSQQSNENDKADKA